MAFKLYIQSSVNYLAKNISFRKGTLVYKNVKHLVRKERIIKQHNFIGALTKYNLFSGGGNTTPHLVTNFIDKVKFQLRLRKIFTVF